MCKIATGRKAALAGFLLLTVAIIGGAPLDAAAAPATSVRVCHVPPDDPAQAHFISVAASAVPAHVAHGDQVLPENVACSVGVGECRAEGALICTAAGLVCDATPGSPPEQTEESCTDGLDNDCDGYIDNADADCAKIPACGDCLTIPAVGCELESCKEAVCAVDEFCCTGWDDICAGEAEHVCVVGNLCTK